MSKKILGIGNAIVDIFVKVDDSFLSKNNLTKGSMKLIEREEFQNLKKTIKVENLQFGSNHHCRRYGFAGHKSARKNVTTHFPGQNHNP